MTVLCLGCERPLAERYGLGRPARYHGPACRQRARRARLATEPDRARLLAVAERVEHAALALRRAVTMGQDQESAAAELLAAASAFAALREGTSQEPHSHEEPSAAESSPVTKPVTEPATEPRVAEAGEPPAGHDQRAGESVTKKVTKPSARRHTERASRPKPKPIDPDTVRLERSADYDVTGTWRVLAGPADDPMLVGFVRNSGRGKHWEARTPSLITVSGGPWRTRQDALVHLVFNHQQAAAARRPGKRRPR